MDGRENALMDGLVDGWIGGECIDGWIGRGVNRGKNALLCGWIGWLAAD